MAIATVFDIKGMTSQQYDQSVLELEKAGLGNPDGRLYHVAAPKDDGWYVVDIWESEEKLGKFSEALVPILMKAGVAPIPPQIYPVHNIITSK